MNQSLGNYLERYFYHTGSSLVKTKGPGSYSMRPTRMSKELHEMGKNPATHCLSNFAGGHGNKREVYTEPLMPTMLRITTPQAAIFPSLGIDCRDCSISARSRTQAIGRYSGMIKGTLVSKVSSLLCNTLTTLLIR